MKAKDIFTPAGFPTITYVDEHLKEKKQCLHDALESGSTLISISGPSKSGKTVFIEHSLGKEYLIQITGAGIGSVGDLWKRVFSIVGTPIESTTISGADTSKSAVAKGGIEGGLAIVKGKGEISGSITYSESASQSQKDAVDYLNLLIKEFAGSDFVVFIDDFHYIPRSVQIELARQIKEAMRQGVQFICASVPYHSDDVIRSNPDLMGRVISIDFDYWESDVLRQIAYKGFNKMNMDFDENMINRLVSESAGSPQLMQSLCLSTCFETNVREISSDKKHFSYDEELLRHICQRTAEITDYSSIVERMIEGPKTRGETRKVYIAKDGWQGDVYKFLVKALALDPPQLNFRYQPLVDRISSLCLNDSPSGSSITNACQHSSSIVNSAAGYNIVEWDGNCDVFDIRDPYFLFYIRWSA